MEFEVHTFRRIVTLSMPVAGTIERIPAVGDRSGSERDSIGWWPQSAGAEFRIDRDETRTHCKFVSDAFIDDAGRLIREEEERLSQLKAFRGDPAVISTRPKEDPFLVAPQRARAQARIGEVKAMLASLLMSERVQDLVEDVPEEAYPLLESRIDKVLPEKAVGLCAGLVGFTESDTRRLACMGLAEALRRREGITVPEIENPSSPYQTVRVNDSVLLAGHKVMSSIESFNELVFAYVTRARTYWATVADKKLYNADDIETLKAWRVIQSGLLPYMLAVEASPEDKLDEAWSAWEDSKKQIQVAYSMAQRIGQIGIECWYKNSWPPEDKYDPDSRGKWVASKAARELGYAIEVANGHTETWKRLSEFLLKFYLLDVSLLAAFDTNTFLDSFSAFIIPNAVDYLVQTQGGINVRRLFGGTEFQQNMFHISPTKKKRVLEFETDVFDEASRDLGGGIDSINAALRDPRNIELHMSGLRSWRHSFTSSFTRMLPQDPQHIQWYYENLYERAYGRLDEIRMALANVASINSLRSVIGAMLERMNSDTVNEGLIDLPLDARVTSVFVQDGEYLAGGRPVLTAVDLFRCNARAFLSSKELAGLPLEPMSVWKVACNGREEAAPGISYVAIVGRIEPERDDEWVVDLELFAVLEMDIDGVSNLPSHLPLSQRYIGVHDAATKESLKVMEETFNSFGTERLELLNRVH